MTAGSSTSGYIPLFRRDSLRRSWRNPGGRSRSNSRDFLCDKSFTSSDVIHVAHSGSKRNNADYSSSVETKHRFGSTAFDRKFSSSGAYRRRNGSVSSNDSGLESGGCISDSDTASVRSMKSGVTCAVVQKEHYDRKLYKTKSAVSFKEGEGFSLHFGFSCFDLLRFCPEHCLRMDV